MPAADINGQKINYEVTGEGTPVVLISGYGSDLSFWNVLVPMLKDKYKVITMDNRGTGKTVYSGKFGVSDLTDDIIALMDHLSIFRAHIVGWSMGGCMAQELSLAYPERVISLTLISAYMRRPARSSHVMNTMIRAVREGASIETLNMIMQGMCFPESVFLKREGSAKTKKQPYMATIDGIADQMVAVDTYDSRKRISGISVPSLSIHGLSDIMVPPEVGDEITSLIKGCKHYRIPGAGHIINPSAYCKRMIDHFEENE